MSNTDLATISRLRMKLKELPAGSPEWHAANHALMQAQARMMPRRPVWR